MLVEEAEHVFGTKWTNWTKTETKEFVRCLEPHELNIPLTLTLAIDNFGLLRESTRNTLVELGYNGR